MSKIQTRLCRDVQDLHSTMGEAVADGPDAVVLFALGLEPPSLVPFAGSVAGDAPVLLADCYGILGFSADEGRNIELMEAGRGREYGGPGGDGGRGVVAVVFSGGGTVASWDELPARATSHMAVAGTEATSAPSWPGRPRASTTAAWPRPRSATMPRPGVSRRCRTSS